MFLHAVALMLAVWAGRGFEFLWRKNLGSACTCCWWALTSCSGSAGYLIVLSVACRENIWNHLTWSQNISPSSSVLSCLDWPWLSSISDIPEIEARTCMWEGQEWGVLWHLYHCCRLMCPPCTASVSWQRCKWNTHRLLDLVSVTLLVFRIVNSSLAIAATATVALQHL